MTLAHSRDAALVRYEAAEGIAVVTLDRPERRNAIDAAMTAALRAAVERCEADAGVRAAILTGAGDRAFCAGMDLKAFLAGEGPAILEGPGGFAGFTTRARTKPVIAAVNGPALAGGCELVLACDLVVMAEQASLGLPEVRRGLFAASGGALRLPAMIPRVRALELLLTGDPVDAQTALSLGLVNRVVPLDRLLDEARARRAHPRQRPPRGAGDPRGRAVGRGAGPRALGRERRGVGARRGFRGRARGPRGLCREAAAALAGSLTHLAGLARLR